MFAAAVAMLREVLASVADRPKRFVWHNRRPYSWRGALLGLTAAYATGRDLTADILLVWFAHQPGDCPTFHLGDAIEACGELWDRDLQDLAWRITPWDWKRLGETA